MSLRAARGRNALTHAFVTAAVGALSWAAAHLAHLQQPYWAVVASVVVIQDDWAATRTAAWMRLLGTALGATCAWLALLAPWPHWAAFLAGSFVAVMVCYLAGIGPAGRLAAVTVGIVTLVPFTFSPAHAALFRSLEVGFGVAVALLWMWVQHRLFGDLTPPEKKT